MHEPQCGFRSLRGIRHVGARSGWNSLTEVERMVVELIVEGLTNPEIARTLFMARRTAQVHVSHILTKLNLASRVDIVREAVRRERQRGVVDVDTGRAAYTCGLTRRGFHSCDAGVGDWLDRL